ncbi:DEAD/DEAH box helicase [Pseudoduganella ginsengisoli]|uniref:DEAD-box ATP-dependent RNA helicase RhpA n=1 Tax=Pseudoduganella ginsengisoli TaxID=1462440 RepID=A0A6L6PZZ5_9BURK|nr:DEAD/DEAH box helicase [Pseudoduganella ginsengisoli]MTW03213.1 DEAD/DEAH box helicase [Pseudoduganella ginsengisoli]
MTFESLGLIDPLLRMLATVGYTEPTPIQQQAIPPILQGRDVLAAAQTGTGKTAGFAIPLLQRLASGGERAAPGMVRCLVLTPTRELAEQVFESFRSYGRNIPMRAYVAYGGVPIDTQIAKLRKGLDVLVATPGRLLDLMGQGEVQFDQLQAVVLDEADRMLDLGFANDLEQILLALPDEKQTLLFSATFPEVIRDLAQVLLNDPVTIQASPRNRAAATVRQWAITTDKRRKAPLLLHLLRKNDWPQVLVFVKTRKGADALVGQLQEHGFKADAIHGDKAQHARLRALERFKAGHVQLLVATDVAARGLDIDALPLVVNFDLPTVAEDYVHRIGRTGRAGMEGEALSLVCADEVEPLRAIEKLTKQVLPRTEVAGYEAEHRVPDTAPAAKPSGKPVKKDAPAKGKQASKPNVDPDQPLSADPRFRTDLDGGFPAATATQRKAPAAKAGPGGKPARGGFHAAQTGRARNPGYGPAAGGAAPKGAVVVTGGRGAKAVAKSAAKATARTSGKRPKR